MADEIKLQIILEDGSVKQGFLNIEKQAKATSKKLESTFDDVGDFVNNPFVALGARLGGFAIVAETAGKAIKKAFDFTLLGEQTKAINTQFNALAQSAGLSATSLRTAINSATQGLIDDEDALKIASQSIVALGDGAARLPDLLNNARNASRALGRDFQDTFGSFSQFVETGNARLLKQFGLVIDTQKAFDAYAKSIGVTTAELTVAQQQQIRLNLLLDTTAQKFSATTESVTPLADEVQRLKVNLQNLSEDAAVSFDNNLNPTLTRLVQQLNEIVTKGPSAAQALGFLVSPITSITNEITKATQVADDFSNAGLLELEANAKKAGAELEALESQLSRYAAIGISKTNPIAFNDLSDSIAKSKEELSRLNFEIISRKQAAEQALINGSGGGAVIPKETPEQIASRTATLKKNESDLTKFIVDQEIQRQQANLKTVNTRESAGRQILSVDIQTQQQIEILEIQRKQRIAQTEEQFSANKQFTVGQRERAVLAINQSFKAQEEKLNRDAAEKIVQLEVDAYQKRLENAKQISQAVSGILISSTTNYVEVIGQRLQRGEALFEDFGESVIALFGDVAISIGKALFVQGLAIEAFIESINSLFPGSGLVAAAAGLGLILFGSALKASVGRGGSSGPEVGGGIASAPSPTTDLTQPSNLTQAEPNTQVSVVIQGDVLDSDESGSRIVDLINSAFDKKGVVINQGVLA